MRFTEASLLKTENNMTTLSEPLVTPKYGKWRQLVLGLICMAAISSPQYVWTLLTKPLAAKLGVGLPELQVTFSLLIILQTFFSPFQGRLVEKFGPRRLIAIGTVMAGMSWVLSAQVNGLATLWLVYGCMGGLGTGIVYIGVVGLMVKWFPQQRGFAAGAVAAGYGMGAIITTFPISLSLTTNGLEHTMTTFGILFALVGFLASQGLKLPPPAVSQPVSQTVAQSSRSFTSREMLRQPLFWLMFVMMAMMSTSGLMVTSQMAVFAEDFGISQAVVFGMAALPLALTIDRFTNGLTRPLFGFISDRFGREQTMFIAFALEGGSDDALAGVPGRSAAVCPALRGGVLWLGGDLLALPVDAHRYVRQRACRQQLWLAVYFAGHRVNLWRSAGGTALSAHSRLACGLQLRDWP
ncbi:putative permease of the major facilitator superfamily [Klebsiella pneumoniae]|uniref:Putative permease of the major facilitator superfamily n=1 Tax=Klebsiella pneumoniae TaxID=573 RepID=A0A508ZWG3_KLEPN|nr:putative permease of the major facilitator superfamily [Klebsiella pneumoniae]